MPPYIPPGNPIGDILTPLSTAFNLLSNLALPLQRRICHHQKRSQNAFNLFIDLLSGNVNVGHFKKLCTIRYYILWLGGRTPFALRPLDYNNPNERNTLWLQDQRRQTLVNHGISCSNSLGPYFSLIEGCTELFQRITSVNSPTSNHLLWIQGHTYDPNWWTPNGKGLKLLKSTFKGNLQKENYYGRDCVIGIGSALQSACIITAASMEADRLQRSISHIQAVNLQNSPNDEHWHDSSKCKALVGEALLYTWITPTDSTSMVGRKIKIRDDHIPYEVKQNCERLISDVHIKLKKIFYEALYEYAHEKHCSLIHFGAGHDFLTYDAYKKRMSDDSYVDQSGLSPTDQQITSRHYQWWRDLAYNSNPVAHVVSSWRTNIGTKPADWGNAKPTNMSDTCLWLGKTKNGSSQTSVAITSESQQILSLISVRSKLTLHMSETSHLAPNQQHVFAKLNLNERQLDNIIFGQQDGPSLQKMKETLDDLAPQMSSHQQQAVQPWIIRLADVFNWAEEQMDKFQKRASKRKMQAQA